MSALKLAMSSSGKVNSKKLETIKKSADKVIEEVQAQKLRHLQEFEESDEECSQAKAVDLKETDLKVMKVKTAGVRKPRRYAHGQYVLPSDLNAHFRGPSRENSSVIGVLSENGSSGSMRIDLLVASKLFVSQCVELSDEITESAKQNEIVLGHYSASLVPYVVLTDLTNETKQTFVKPAALEALVQSLEQHIKSHQTVTGDDEDDSEIEEIGSSTQKYC